jgi:phosphate transport system substrate-binding protein
MTDAEIKKAKDANGEMLHIPVALGPVAVVYNLPDVKGQLRLTGPLLAKIYLGEITSWNDEAIVNCNPDVTLPDLEITTFARREATTTTKVWTEYLSTTSASFKKNVGSGMSVKWPAGVVTAEGNSGMVEKVKNQKGAIGYVELPFAREQKLTVAHVKNSAGKYIEPNLKSATAAADAALKTIPEDLRYSLIDAPGDDSYPLVGTTWLIVYSDQTASKQSGKELVKFLLWAVGDGQKHLKGLRYAPLPEKLAELAKKKIELIKTAE